MYGRISPTRISKKPPTKSTKAKWVEWIWVAPGYGRRRARRRRATPEEGEQVEATAQPTKDARGLNHAVRDNCIDINGDEHDELGWFTGSNSIRSKMPLSTSGKKPKVLVVVAVRIIRNRKRLTCQKENERVKSLNKGLVY